MNNRAVAKAAAKTLLSAGVMLNTGCGERTMPKGTGASGKVATVSAKADDRLDLINKLNESQQRAFDRLHEPYSKVFATPPSAPPKGFKSMADFQRAWDALKFCDVKENQKFVYFATFITSAGEFEVRFDDVAPNHLRSFIVLAQAGYFNDTPGRTVNNAIVFGAADGKSEYRLPVESVDLGVRMGGLVVFADKDGKTPLQFAILLKSREDLAGKVAVLGNLANQHVADNVRAFEAVQKAAGKSLTLKEVRVKRMDEGKNPLFTADGVALPTVDEKGKIKILTPQEREEMQQKRAGRKGR